MAGYAEIALVRGMSFLAESQSAIANNLANLETSSYKRRAPVAVESALAFDKVLGRKLPTVAYGEVAAFTEGNLRESGDRMEIALGQDSWLRVEDGQGKKLLTRNGQLQIDQQGRLVNRDGMRLLDQTGNPITLGVGEELPADISIAPNGEVSDPLTGRTWGPIGVFRVRDASAMQPVGGGNYLEPANQPLELVADGVQQGYREGSNVDSLQELVQMIVVQRSFSATQKALGTVGRMQDRLIENSNR